MAFDTETTLVDLTTTIPELVCLSAADEDRAVVVFPDQVSQFLKSHAHFKRLAAWNLGFDWWVVSKLFPSLSWSAWVDEGKFGDTMLLEQLVRLAEGRDLAQLFQLSVKKAAKEYLDREVTKDADIREGFTPEMVVDWQAHMKSWEYAAEDAAVTYDLDEVLCARAVKAAERCQFPAPAGWGLLTEQIQVRAAVALPQITRNGLAVDAAAVTALDSKLRETHGKAISSLTVVLPGLIQRYGKRARKAPPGTVKMSKTGLPQMSDTVLQAHLEQIATKYNVKPPRTPKSKAIQTGADWWEENVPDDPFVREWLDMEAAAKGLGFLKSFVGKGEVHAKYTTLVKTGRSAASNPQVHQVPRPKEYRELFVARSGHVLVAADYAAIELRTLAAVCEQRLGHSQLGKVLRAGVDPHANTARVVLGLDDTAWASLTAAERKAKRQSAKAVNFGIPGGLGPPKLRSYARVNYGVNFTLDEAREIRLKVIREVYPEWEEWLADGLSVRLRYSLRCSAKAAESVFGRDAGFLDPIDHPAVRVFAGHHTKKDGEKFSTWYVENVWQNLEHCLEAGQAPDWVANRIVEREPGPDLAEYLVQIPAVTLTGRIRKKVYYGEFRNTQFQGLAADGAKLAMWELVKRGYRVVAFVHDELLTEVPEQGAEDAARRIADIMSSEFARVLPGDIPVGVETAIGRTWVKP